MFAVPRQRIVAGASATIGWQPVDSDGEPGDPGGVVTVAVSRSDGTEVLPAGTAATGTGDGPRTVALERAHTVEIDRLTATWSVDGIAVATTIIEVVGGVFVTMAEIRGAEQALADPTAYPDAALKRARAEVETQFEDAASRAFVARFHVETVKSPGTDRIVLSRPALRSVAWVTDDVGPLTLPTIPRDDSGIARRADETCWPCGTLTVGYVHGWDAPPADVQRAVIRAIRGAANTFRTEIPDRATNIISQDGTEIVLATPGLGPWVTGIPEVDETIQRYRWDVPSVA